MAKRDLSVVQPQTGMDETTIEDAELEDALEKRQVEKSALSEQRKAYKEANEATKVGIAKLELPDGHAVRIGRFRITRTAIPGRHVDFDVDPRSQVSIAFLGD